MELRHLRYFLAVAESEHVSRAAEQLHISQPPLSRAIRELETELGIALFTRAKRRLRITSQGTALLEDARAVLSQSQQLLQRAQAFAAGTRGQLRVGYVDGAMQSGVLGRYLRRYRQHSPAVHVELIPMRSGAQIRSLRMGDIDVAFLYTPPIENDDIAAYKVLVEPLMLATPSDDSLVHKRAIRPRDLDGSPWVALPRSLNALWRDRFLSLCSSAGFRPDIRAEATQLSVVLGLVEAGMGRAFVQASAARGAPPLLHFRRLTWWPHTIEVWVAWRKERLLPAAVSFLGTNGLIPKDTAESRRTRRPDSNRHTEARPRAAGDGGIKDRW
jgi:DNA-binding transcriptional LysR family regulator